MCGVIVVDAELFRSTWHGRDAYIHDHCLRYRHNFALFYQLLDSNLFTHLLFSFMREASSETYAPGSIFHHISFRSTILHSFTFWSINQKNQKTFSYVLFSFIYLYLNLTLAIDREGIGNPFIAFGASVWLFVQVHLLGTCTFLILDWYLGS